MPLTSEPGGTFPVSDNKVSIEHCAFFQENMYHFPQKNLIFFLNYVPQTLPTNFLLWLAGKPQSCIVPRFSTDSNILFPFYSYICKCTVCSSGRTCFFLYRVYLDFKSFFLSRNKSETIFPHLRASRYVAIITLILARNSKGCSPFKSIESENAVQNAFYFNL